MSKLCDQYQDCLPSWMSDELSLNDSGWNRRNIEGALENPGSYNKWFKSNGGYSGNLYVWEAAGKLGFTYKGQFADVVSYANQPRTVVVLNVNNEEHWVLSTGYANDEFSVFNPGYNRSSCSRGEVVDAGVYTY
jgi:hypothetical protein